MAIADLLAKLVELKSQLVTNLNSMGVTANESEKLNTLVPKVLKCKTDVIWSQNTVSSEVTSVNIPNGVTNIADYAFEGCTSLTGITIPDSVTSIGSEAFSGTALLANQTGVKYADTWVIGYDTDITSAEIRDGTRGIADYAFMACTNLTSITIPDSVTSISDSAFWDCASLSSVTIGNGVTSIRDNAFRNCKSLSSITIPDNVMYIGANAFYNCTSLESVTIGNGVISIGDFAFFNCPSLVNIYVSENNNNYSDINGVLFNKNKSELLAYPTGKIDNEYSIPNGVTSIRDYAFMACKSLSSIIIPDSVTSIGDDAFMACINLESITIPDSVTSIGDEAFENCSGLSSVTIGNGVTSIGDLAFAFCTSLAHIYYKGTEEQWNAITKGMNWNDSMGTDVEGRTVIVYNYTG